MNDEPRGAQTEANTDDSTAKSLRPGEPESASELGVHEPGAAQSGNTNRDSDQNPSKSFRSRLTANEWLTLLIGLGSLAVSALTWRTISDTSDIKTAIRNLSDLAAQTERQANAANGQIEEMRDEQRPWLQVNPQIRGPLVNDEGRISINIGLGIRNSGRTPAVAVMGKAELKPRRSPYEMAMEGLSTSVGAELIKLICKNDINGANPVWKYIGSDDSPDIIFPGSDDIIEVIAGDDHVDPKYGGYDLGSKWGVLPSFNLVFCVAYKAVRGDETLHTGGIISLSVPDGTGPLGSGQSIPAAALKLERYPFQWSNYAD